MSIPGKHHGLTCMKISYRRRRNGLVFLLVDFNSCIFSTLSEDVKVFTGKIFCYILILWQGLAKKIFIPKISRYILYCYHEMTEWFTSLFRTALKSFPIIIWRILASSNNKGKSHQLLPHFGMHQSPKAEVKNGCESYIR